MQYDHKPYRAGIFGQSGTGKTTFFINLLHGLKASCVFLPDPEGEFETKLGRHAATNLPGCIAQIKNGWCLFNHRELFPGDAKAGVEWFANFAFYTSHKLPGRKVIAIDEFQKYAGHGDLKDVGNGHGGKRPNGLKLILDTGRRYGLDFVGISQAPNRLDLIVRDQLTEVICFKMVGARALEYIADMDFNPEDVRRLPGGSYIARNLLSGATARGKVF